MEFDATAKPEILVGLLEAVPIFLPNYLILLLLYFYQITKRYIKRNVPSGIEL